MKFVSQGALVGVLFAACAVPVEIDDKVQLTLPDASDSFGGASGGAAPGSGGSGLSSSTGGSGVTAQGGTGAATGGTGATQGGAGGAAQGGAGGMGGSMMAMGGAAGTGMGGTGVEPPPTNCVETGSVGGFITEVLYQHQAHAASTQSMDFTLAIRNTGAALNMNQVSVRYWFTPGTTQPFTFACYYAQSAAPANLTLTGDVNVTFGQNEVSAYAEVTVNRTDPLGTGINQIQLSLRANNVTLLHTDDFSYDPDAPAFELNPNISAYVDGEQVFGCEPPDL